MSERDNSYCSKRAREAIELFLEYRDKHGKSEQDAIYCAISEFDDAAHYDQRALSATQETSMKVTPLDNVCTEMIVTGAVEERPTYVIHAEQPGYSGAQPFVPLSDFRKLSSRLRDAEQRAERAESDAKAARDALEYNLGIANTNARAFQAERDSMIRALRREYSAIEIALMVGLTRQRVHQILNEPEEKT